MDSPKLKKKENQNMYVSSTILYLKTREQDIVKRIVPEKVSIITYVHARTHTHIEFGSVTEMFYRVFV